MVAIRCSFLKLFSLEMFLYPCAVLSFFFFLFSFPPATEYSHLLNVTTCQTSVQDAT